jgi:hypothetical protein
MSSKKQLYYFYYLVLDLEKSSSQYIPLNIQIEKLEKLRLCVNKIISIRFADSLNRNFQLNNNIIYINQTGDGYFIIFENGEDALRFSIEVHKYLNIHNRKIENKKVYSQREIDFKKIIANIGISYGQSKPYKQIDGQTSYWGTDVVLSHRIVDYAKGGYILCSSKVYDMLKNTDLGKFLDLECPTIFKHNLKTNLYLFYNGQDKEIFDNLNIHLC